MSINNFSPSVTNLVPVIARAFQDQPVLLRAAGTGKGIVNVVGDDPNRRMAYPAGYVYRYNKGLLENLRSAFSKRNTVRLLELWGKAEHYE